MNWEPQGDLEATFGSTTWTYNGEVFPQDNWEPQDLESEFDEETWVTEEGEEIPQEIDVEQRDLDAEVACELAEEKDSAFQQVQEWISYREVFCGWQYGG